MANISVTNTFTSGTAMNAVDVMRNFDDIVNGLSDGTKDISVSSANVAGYASVTGNMYTTALTDFSGTVTVGGFSSLSHKVFYYKKIGKTVFVWFQVGGTLDSSEVYFSLPVTADASMASNIKIVGGASGMDEGDIDTDQSAYILLSAANANMYVKVDNTWPDFCAYLSGYFSYEAA